MSLVIKFEPGLRPVVKHQEHDQSTHGSWANGEGSSGLSRREIYELQYNMTDPQKSAVYKAEEKHQPQTQKELPKPFPPNNRNEYATREEYDAAYKKYSKEFDEWARESSRNIQSETGKKTLDGSRAGTQKYIDSITKSDWFIKEFGDDRIVEVPKVALRDNRVAGQYTFGFKNGQPYSAMVINKGFSLNEPTILHEIAHYATTISARERFSPHGKEFAKNHVYLASKVISPEYASGLEKAYREEGIDLGN